jgi:hypothetical protein
VWEVHVVVKIENIAIGLFYLVLFLIVFMGPLAILVWALI